VGQGKRRDQIERSSRHAAWAMIGMIILIIGMTLFGCGIQNETTKKKEDCCQSK
jgi:hypothetical protein